jgi:acyl-coenzyme A thioesterase PaaI-like protein
MGELTVEDGVFRGSMSVGPWLAVRRRTPAGSVAVLVDDLLGYAITADLPGGRWSVSTEITLDVLRPLPATGRVLADGRLVQSDAQGGYATGTVRNEEGTRLAVCTQRGRFIPAPDGLVEEGAWGGPPRPGDLERLLAVRDGVPMPTTDVLANEGGNLHGGVSMFVSDLVACALRPDLVTASLHITYARAIPIGADVSWRATVRHDGRSLAVVDVDGVVDDRVGTTARVVLHPPH